MFSSPGEADSFRPRGEGSSFRGHSYKRGLCGASAGTQAHSWEDCGAVRQPWGRRTARSTEPHPPHPCRVPRLSTSHPEPAVTRMCPHSQAMAAEEPESLVLQGQSQGLAACCRPASQPAAGQPASLEPAWATLMTQFLCTAPTEGGEGQRGGRGMESSPARWLVSASRVCCPTAGGLGKLTGTQG